VALTQFIVHAIVQAVTEVFPISSGGHAALLSYFSVQTAPSRVFTLGLQVGLLLAVLAYFWRDVADMVGGVIRVAKGKPDPGARLVLQILIAAVLTLALGFAFERYVAGPWQTPVVLGWAVVGLGVLMLLFDRMSMTVKRVEHTGYGDAIAVGVCYVLGLIPGVGGAAAAMTMARLLGYERGHAVRLAFLLAIPVWAAVIARDAYVTFRVEGAVIGNLDIAAAGVAFIAALVSIAILMSWLRRATFTPFLVYRLLIGTAVLLVAYDVIEL
jgi:undecaprenyl-diphosphatase